MKRSKLTLNADTLRVLAGAALREIRGGAVNTAAGTDCSVQTVDAYTCQGTCNGGTCGCTHNTCRSCPWGTICAPLPEP